MKRPIPVRSHCGFVCSSAFRRSLPPIPAKAGTTNAGFTLIEILVATTLSLILLAAVITMFGNVSNSISDSRGMLESADRLRLAEERLQMDLAGLTATPNPPRKPENHEGYLEIIEGPATATLNIAVNSDNSNNPDTTVGDFDDILMLTTRSSGRPFVGKCVGAPNGVIQSDVAEVAWFLRGRTLHRRVLLVKPGAFASRQTSNYYVGNDVSAYYIDANNVAPNTLGDLTRRECRFAHAQNFSDTNVANFPFRIPWTWSYSGNVFPTLPTLNECSASLKLYPDLIQKPGTINPLDFWANPTTDTTTGNRLEDNAFIGGGTTAGSRPSDDIILTNVIGFDVKVWDPTANSNQGAYVDLGHAGISYTAAPNSFRHLGDGPLAGTPSTSRIYDTWSTSYFSSNWINGIDDNASTETGYGIVDDDSEKGANRLPPYPIPLRGIQVKIRVFEPDSKQVREVTVVQDFLPQ